MSEDPSLNALLRGVDPQDREAVSRAYYDMAHGEPSSYPVVFALCLNSAVRSIADSAERIEKAARRIEEAARPEIAFSEVVTEEWAARVAKNLEDKAPSFQDLRNLCEKLTGAAAKITGSAFSAKVATPAESKTSFLPFLITGLVSSLVTLAGVWLMIHS
jgi:hypothetical protein